MHVNFLSITYKYYLTLLTLLMAMVSMTRERGYRKRPVA